MERHVVGTSWKYMKIAFIWYIICNSRVIVTWFFCRMKKAEFHVENWRFFAIFKVYLKPWVFQLVHPNFFPVNIQFGIQEGCRHQKNQVSLNCGGGAPMALLARGLLKSRLGLLSSAVQCFLLRGCFSLVQGEMAENRGQYNSTNGVHEWNKATCYTCYILSLFWQAVVS